MTSQSTNLIGIVKVILISRNRRDNHKGFFIILFVARYYFAIDGLMGSFATTYHHVQCTMVLSTLLLDPTNFIGNKQNV